MASDKDAMVKEPDNDKDESANMKELRANAAKSIKAFLDKHPGAEGFMRVRHGNNVHAIDEDGNIDPDPNSGHGSLYMDQTQRTSNSSDVAKKLYPLMK